MKENFKKNLMIGGVVLWVLVIIGAVLFHDKLFLGINKKTEDKGYLIKLQNDKENVEIVTTLEKDNGEINESAVDEREIRDNTILEFKDEKEVDLPGFGQFLVNSYGDISIYDSSIQHATRVDYEGSKELKEMYEYQKANIDGQFEKGPNFADHYVAITLGCGTACRYLLIADAINGKLYDPRISSAWGFDFDIDSKLIISDPPWTIYALRDSIPPSINLPSIYYVWENNQSKLIKEYYLDISVKEKK